MSTRQGSAPGEPVTLMRGQIGKTLGLDITVKSGEGPALVFAPTWGMVMGHKRGTLTSDQYTERYHRVLLSIPPGAWRWLYEQARDGRLRLLCYCRDGAFCHTNLLIEYAITRWPNLFKDGRT